jgi:hypothetical protein
MLKVLKQFIKEEVERNMRWTAGIFGGGNIGKSRKGTVVPPPGLGEDPEETEEQNGKKEQTHRVAEEQRRRRVSRND